MVTVNVAYTQQFQFGVSAGVVASQIDGDNLRGFHKVGYQAGLLGGYAVDARNWIVVELKQALYGSSRRQEQTTHLEIDIRSIDVVLAYGRRFGDRWDGQQRFRVLAGPRLHRIIVAKSETLNRTDLATFFLSAQITLSHLIGPATQLDLAYAHGLSDILDTELTGVGKLQPYFLSFGVSHHF